MTPSRPSRFQRGLLASLFAVLLLGSSSINDARAQKGAPDSVSFQGFLTKSGGLPLDTMVSMTFKLYKNGTPAWTETQPSVTVTNSVFDVLLGSVTPLDTVAFDQPIDLGITVGADPEIVPRTPLVGAAFALAIRGLHAVWAEDGSSKGYNIVGGASTNTVSDGVVSATIGGGGGIRIAIPQPNSVTGDYGTIGGGRLNMAGLEATIGGGDENIAAGQASVVAGGHQDTASANFSTISGGFGNKASATSATVGGGQENTATDQAAVVAGGQENHASGFQSAVGGGAGNVASALRSTVPGGLSNSAGGQYSFAAGRRAKANHNGTFVWGDATDADFASTAINTFLIRASGGVGIGKNDPGFPLEMASGAHVTVGGVWTDASSRTLKQDFQAVEVGAILEEVVNLPVTRWRYKNEPGAVHMGPVAEDFHELFGLGPDGGHIAALDGNGVALAAIQGLYSLIVKQQQEIDALKNGPAPTWSPLDER